MRTSQRNFLRRIVAMTACLLLSSAAGFAQADMLPMVVDQTRVGAPSFWWSSAQPQHHGVIDRALFDENTQGIVRPARLQNFAVSRVFQRSDISVVNAQQLARMTGSTSFFLGVANAETLSVGWLGSTSAIVTIRGALYDTRSGRTIGDVEIVGRGVSTTPDQAVQIAARSASRDLLNFQPGAGQDPSAAAPLEVVLRVHDGASAFVRLRDHFARAIEGRGELGECRASEGEVVLCIRTMPGGDSAQLRSTLMQSLRAPFPDIILDEVREDDTRIYIRARNLPTAPGWGTEGRLPL